MQVRSIPPWTSQGVLPPVNPDNPVGPDRSPYQVSLVDIVLRFGDSPERQRILDGFLRFRRELHAAGFVEGFQWIDGSFLENVERLEGRPPNDVDVVTFVDGASDVAIHKHVRAILDHDAVKAEYSIDHYFVELNLPGRILVAHSAYWSGLWSHRRSMQWKGFLQVELARDDDEEAARHLNKAIGSETGR